MDSLKKVVSVAAVKASAMHAATLETCVRHRRDTDRPNEEKTALNGNSGLQSARKTQRHKEHYPKQDIRQRRSGPKFRQISHQIPAGTTDSRYQDCDENECANEARAFGNFFMNRGGLVGTSAAMRLLHLNLLDLVEAELYETRCHATVKASCRLFTATVSTELDIWSNVVQFGAP
jgi:hypothetical protein